jgi:serine/threonine protein kinase
VRASESQESSYTNFGPYCIERRIAVGGSAEVFLAHDRQSPNKQLVIKRLLPAVRSQGDLDALSREAELHKRVDHANVVKVYYAGQADGEPYIAMEYVQGLDLHRLLQRSSSGKQAIPPELAAFIVRSVADALHAVHSVTTPSGEAMNLVHADVSPSNIYLSASGEVKLGDFGIARVMARREADERHRAAGHFGYLAPEQLTGEGHDFRADLFSLGVILGELLIGQKIFPGSGQLAVMLSIRDANILPLRRAAEKLPAGLFEVCERVLRRSPEERFGSAKEFCDALAPFVQPSNEKLKGSMASWVTWAMDHTLFVENLEKRVRESVGVMHAAHRSSSGIHALKESANPMSDSERPRVRRLGQVTVEEVPFAKLIEMVATGDLGLEDEVALWGSPFEAVGKIEELARHLLPSTTAVTTRMFSLKPPDFVADFKETSLLWVLGKLHNQRSTGALFVSQSFKAREQRKDIYVANGRLQHVASNDPHELLGEYLVGKGVLKRAQLDAALKHMAATRGQLGETLIALNMVDPVDVFTAIRNQGRDRVATLCAWDNGNAQFYEDTTPEHVRFPLDLDLTICMMWGAMRQRLRVPEEKGRVLIGPSAPEAGHKSSSVAMLNLIPGLARKQAALSTARTELQTFSRNKAEAASLQAEAALVVSEALGWVQFE